MTGIICATETEMKAIINEIEDIKENKIGRITFFEGKFKLAFFSFVLNLKFNCNRGGLFLGERWEETLKSMVEIRRKC